MNPEVQARMLAATLTAAREAYYNGTPSMTDAEFDRLEDELRLLDPNNTFFTKVGAPVSSGWQKVRHVIPMGSLNKAQTKDDLARWYKNHANGKQVICMDKLDGISISLRYEDGQLVQAVTRGDGVEGEDITRNVRMMQVPTEPLIEDCWIRGEIVCKKSDFDAHFQGESNPRNTASGTAKRQTDASKCKHLTIIAFEYLPDDGPCTTKSEELTALQQKGFTVPRSQEAINTSEVFGLYDAYLDMIRGRLDYEIDGLVVRLDDNDDWTAAGEKNHRPAGSVAFKFPHDSKETSLNSVVWQVGKSGRITPVAEFAPVNLAGANVSRASLHNWTNMQRLGADQGFLRTGDKILVSRRNDVIPYVEKVVTHGSGLPCEAPDECPACGHTVTKVGEYLVCKNSVECPAQVSGAIKRWVNKVGILQWGDTVIDCLVDSGLVETIADLYELEEEMLSSVDLNGRKLGSAAKTMLENLHAKKELPLHVFVGSMGIDLWGRSMVKKLVDQGYDTIDQLANATSPEIAALPQMGQTKADAFVIGFEVRKRSMDQILQYVTLQAPSTGPMKGMTICMTGFRDPAMHEAIENAGGTVKSSVSKGLHYLVLKDINSTSGKAKKARAQGTQCVGIEHMWGLLGGRP